MCDQQRLRPACAYAQSDPSVCLSLKYSLTVKLLTDYHLEFLSLKGGCTGSSESQLVKMPHCWKSHATAQMQLRDSVKHFIVCNDFIEFNYTAQINFRFYLSYDAKITYKSHFRRGNFKIVPYKQHSIWYWRRQRNTCTVESF